MKKSLVSIETTRMANRAGRVATYGAMTIKAADIELGEDSARQARRQTQVPASDASVIRKGFHQDACSAAELGYWQPGSGADLVLYF